MNSIVGWSLAAAALAFGWMKFGWQGVVLALTVVVFWLLLQFSRALRVMKQAAAAPIGQVTSAVMLNTKLRSGMTMMQVLPLTRSLGQRIESPAAHHQTESWRWADEGGSYLTLTFVRGQLDHWHLHRPTQPGDLTSELDRAGAS
jgi:hypothetical protein